MQMDNLNTSWNSLKTEACQLAQQIRLPFTRNQNMAQIVHEYVMNNSTMFFVGSTVLSAFISPTFVILGGISGGLAASAGPYELYDQPWRVTRGAPDRSPPGIWMGVQAARPLFRFGNYMDTPTKQGWLSIGLMLSHLVLKSGVAAFATGFMTGDYLVHYLKNLTWERSGHQYH